MKKRFLSVAAGVLAVSAILAGCGSGAAKSESSAEKTTEAATSTAPDKKEETTGASLIGPGVE